MVEDFKSSEFAFLNRVFKDREFCSNMVLHYREVVYGNSEVNKTKIMLKDFIEKRQ